jgi:enoyl-CoA hydratase/carnithine racemase
VSERVRYTIAEGVADVRLARPEKLNALDVEMFLALVEASDALRGQAEVRAVVLSGEGRAFCAGLDLAVFAHDREKEGGAAAFAAAVLARRGDGVASVAQQAVIGWSTLPVPVIAAVHGHAYGGGLQLALGADIRIVAPDARLAVMEMRWGMIPDMGGSQILPGLVGRDVAKELTFTGRVVSGEEAMAIGLATRVSAEPYEDARALARDIAAKSPSAIGAAKDLLNMAGTVSWEVGLLAEQQAQRRLLGSADQTEAVLAFLEQRPPRWNG